MKEAVPNCISFVIPVFNEESNVEPLIGRLSTLKRPENTSVRVVFSDNGSTDKTMTVLGVSAQARISDNFQVAIVEGSIRQSIGSARRVGVDYAIREVQSDSTNHIIISMDADTLPTNPDFLSSILSAYWHNPQLVATIGPTDFLFGTEFILKTGNQTIRLLRRFILWNAFKQNGRRMKDYIRPPYDILPGYNTTFRSTLFCSTGFLHQDKAGEDVRISLSIQHTSSPNSVCFLPRQRVLTSGRAYATRSRRPSPVKIYATLLGQHAAYGHGLSSTEESPTLKIVKEFITDVDTKNTFTRVITS